MFDKIPDLLLGAVVGFSVTKLLSLFINLIKFLSSMKFNTEMQRIKGSWYIHTCIRDAKGTPIVSSSSLEIRLTPFLKYGVKSFDGNNDPYFGTAFREANNLVLKLRARDRKYLDLTYHKISLISFDDYQTLYGTFVSTDYRQRVCAGISILSKTEIPKNKIAKIINENYDIFPNIGAISIK